jgi:hypothetical protein
MERAGGSGYSDKVSLTIENRGPAIARNLDVAMLESEDRKGSQPLGELVERTEKRGGYSGVSPEHYFEITWELGGTRPLQSLSAHEQVIFPFWLRYRSVGHVGFRVTWEDGRGPQVAKPFVPFNVEPAGRF